MDYPDTLCKILILSPVTQTEASASNCGNVVAVMDQAGCYETPALQGDEFMIQYCCGSDDCEKATGEILLSRDVEIDRADKDATELETVDSQSEPIMELAANPLKGQNATASVSCFK